MGTLCFELFPLIDGGSRDLRFCKIARSSLRTMSGSSMVYYETERKLSFWHGTAFEIMAQNS